MDSNGGKFKTSRNDNKNKRDYEVKRAEVRIAAIGLALTALFSLVSAALTGWGTQLDEQQLELAQQQMSYSQAQLDYSITIQCDPNDPDHLVELLIVKNVGDGIAKNVNIVLHDTGSEILGEPESLLPHTNCKPSVYTLTMTTIAVTVPSLHADATYQMRIPLANYGNTAASRALEIASLQRENAEITTESRTRGRARGKINEPEGFPDLRTHTVQEGEQLSDIAAKYDLSTESLVMYNPTIDDPSDPDAIKPEQILIVQPAICGETTIASAISPSSWGILGYHEVQPDETLFGIARTYSVDPYAITAINGLLNPSAARPGQFLAIPNLPFDFPPGGITYTVQLSLAPPACRYYHVARPDESLFDISLTYGVSMWEIATANGISNLNYVRVGDVLCIP